VKLHFKNEKVERQCTSKKVAKKLFGGNEGLAIKLMGRINMLKQAETIKDIVVQKQLFFHKLKNKNGKNLEGHFAIDVKSRRDKWRIILQPLNENEEPYDTCNIDEIAENVRIVEITEVSNHYE